MLVCERILAKVSKILVKFDGFWRAFLEKRVAFSVHECRADSGTGNAKEASRGDTEGDSCVPSWAGGGEGAGVEEANLLLHRAGENTMHVPVRGRRALCTDFSES